MSHTHLEDFYTFEGHFTFDLHDLAAIVLRERQQSVDPFKRARVVEICEGDTTATCLPPHAQTMWTSMKAPHKTAYFLKTEADLDDAANLQGPLEVADFFDPEMKLSPGHAPLTDKEKEMVYWKIRHHDGGILICEALQQVLDALPEDRTRLRIRTSQGLEIPQSPIDAFGIGNVAVIPRESTYICDYQHIKPLSTQVGMNQYLSGHTSEPQPVVYLLFGDSSIPAGGLVALDLASPSLGMRGLGGESFALERVVDYHKRVLPNGGKRVIDYDDSRSEEYDGFFLTDRIRNFSRPELEPIVNDLAERVIRRLSRIARGEETFCAYCGKVDAKDRCSKCKTSMYCGRACQTSAWKYHKKWCVLDAK
ncbi:hypothetical protein SCHPADRAFT_822765 [Schizopora paradoxa]|uniref:MYND-type domain-containing protein n=1 Tax=Schizopora paradoxa TaxID=27342 RepID=A0A0H2SI25_9AGAM|nr:hypothetical protein SCHPADRAFT_822765 [Schizopora paradoxa]